MTRANWDETWETMSAIFGSLRSPCARRRVGAVIVDQRNQVRAFAYNGPPAGMEHSGGCLSWCTYAQQMASGHPYTGYAKCPSIHAEANALLQADRSLIKGGTIYVSSAVCMDCAKLISNSGLSRVVMTVLPGDMHRRPRDVAEYLDMCGVECVAHYTHGADDEGVALS